jgi:glycosyltransferase involved in cell wall biosynthesis
MGRLIYLAEGAVDDPSHFSGIPYFFTPNLQSRLEEAGIQLEIIDTSHLLNVEELIDSIGRMWSGVEPNDLPLGKGAGRSRKIEFSLNEMLFDRLKAASDYSACAAILEDYYERVAGHMKLKLQDVLRTGDVLLSQNHFYPYVSMDWPIYFYLDTGLVDFYFNRRHGAIPERRRMNPIRDLYRRMEASVLGKARTIFCFSASCKRDLASRYEIPSDNFVVVGGGVNFDSFPNFRRREAGAICRLLFIGLDFRRKGGAELLRAMTLLRDEPVELTIVTKSESLAECLNLPNVTALGPQGKAELQRLYEMADIFVFPTLFEPFGLVLCEAMAHSLPVISSNAFAVPEILGEANARCLAPCGDSERLAETIRELAYRPRERERIGRFNYDRAKRLFQWAQVADRIIAHCFAPMTRGSAIS